MKICLYSPYIPQHTGGGEKYLLSVAVALSKLHQVTIALPTSTRAAEIAQIRERYESFFHLDLSAISFATSPLFSGFVLEKLRWTSHFDVCIAVTDGSVFFSGAKKNVLHIQVPYTAPQRGILAHLKLAQWQVKNANSQFTKNVVEHAWKTTIEYVHYPPIDDECFQQSENKEKVIVSVGRFFRQLHSKRQDILVQCFLEARRKYPHVMDGWRLVLIGGAEDESYLQEVRSMAQAAPIDILTSLSRAQVLEWYRRATLYWHAAGYEIDPQTHPEKVEHFGISTAEAMASGCVPLVVPKGGQREVVGEAGLALSWNTIEECVEQSVRLIQHPTQLRKMSAYSIQQARTFSSTRFIETLYEMIGASLS